MNKQMAKLRRRFWRHMRWAKFYCALMRCARWSDHLWHFTLHKWKQHHDAYCQIQGEEVELLTKMIREKLYPKNGD